MNEKNQNQIQDSDTPTESPYESYGWDFHKKPLLYALLLTAAFYAFVFFFISI